MVRLATTSPLLNIVIILWTIFRNIVYHHHPDANHHHHDDHHNNNFSPGWRQRWRKQKSSQLKEEIAHLTVEEVDDGIGDDDDGDFDDSDDDAIGVFDDDDDDHLILCESCQELGNLRLKQQLHRVLQPEK